MSKRKALKKSVRFEVFKRDKFTCQYCGKKAPDVVLVCDHVNPKSKGGSDDIMNLVASCEECNLGKGAKELSDDSAIEKRRSQLESLQERREQIEMMIQWQTELENQDDQLVDAVDEKLFSLCKYFLNERGRILVKKAIRDYGFSTLMESLEVSASRYSAELVIDKAIGIAKYSNLAKDEPEIARVFHIGNILAKRYSNFDGKYAAKMMRDGIRLGVPLDEFEKLVNERMTAYAVWKRLEHLLDEYRE